MFYDRKLCLQSHKYKQFASNYDCRVVIYVRRSFIKFATEWQGPNESPEALYLIKKQVNISPILASSALWVQTFEQVFALNKKILNRLPKS